MPSKNIKNIPRRVNLDDDIRVLENYDLRDARNIRIMSSSGSESGSVESIPSTVEVSVVGVPVGINTQQFSHSITECKDIFGF